MSWQRSAVPEVPGVPDSGDGGLRAANARLRDLLAERDARLRDLLAERDARIAEQAAENAVPREALAELQSQVADLAAQVKASSRNSSRPPSSDGPAKPAPKSLRGRSGRKPGRPKGQPGATMELSGHPDKKVRHRPAKCGRCGKSLRNTPVQYGPRIMSTGIYLWHGQLCAARRCLTIWRCETVHRRVVAAAG